MGGAQVALLVALLAAQGWAEEVVLTLNTKKAVHSVSDKFLSVTLDPATLMQGEELGSGTVCTLSMARGLAPAYLRVAGHQSNHLRFQRALFPDEQRDNYTIREAHWLVLNHFAQQTGLELVVALAADQRVDGAWDPRNSLELIAFSDKLGFNVSAWQLGYELQRVRGSSGAQLGRDVTRLRHILDAFPRYSASAVVAPDVVAFKSREDVDWLRDFVEEAGSSLAVLSWHPKFPMSLEHSSDGDEDSELYFPPDSLVWEKENLYRALGRHSGFKRPLWIAESHSGECRGWFLDALQWAHKLGVAARLGANAIFRQPDMRVLLQPTPDYWVSLLHKRLVGGTVLDARLAHGNKTYVHAFSHCSATPVGGVTVWAVNLLDRRMRVNVRATWGKASVDKIDVHQYVLTAAGDDGLHSGRTLLNGELLALNPSGELPILEPRIRRLGRSPSMTMPARSIAFWLFPEAHVRPCMDVSHKKMVTKEREKQENSEEDISDFEKHKYIHVDRDREDDSKERYQAAAKVKRKIQTNKREHSVSTSEEYNSAETREILYGGRNKKNSKETFTNDHYIPSYSLKTKHGNAKYYDEEKNEKVVSGRRNMKFSYDSSESDSRDSSVKKYKKQMNPQEFSESKTKFIKPTSTYPKKYQPKHAKDVEEKIEKLLQEMRKYEHIDSESIESELLKKAKRTEHKNIPLSNGPKNSDSDEDESKYQQNKKKWVPFQDQVKSADKHDADINKNVTKLDHVRQINETNNGMYNYAIDQHEDSLSSSSENNSSKVRQVEHSHSSEYNPPHTTESHESERYLKSKLANSISNSPKTTTEVPKKGVIMEILHNGIEEESGVKKSRVARSIAESGPYIIPGLSPDQPKIKSITKRRKEDSVRQPRKTKKPKEINKLGTKWGDDLQESIVHDPNKPISYEDADHLFGDPSSHNIKDDSFPSGDVFLKETGESQEKNNDYDYVGDDDEKLSNDHNHSEDVTANEDLPSKYHGLGHFFENVRITMPQIKENLINHGELWEAEGYGEYEETHNTGHEEEDSKVIPHEELSDEHDRKIKNKTANMLKSYFDNTRDSNELDMEEEHRKQKIATKKTFETTEGFDYEGDSSKNTGSGSYPCIHHHPLSYHSSRQQTHQDLTENTPGKARYRAKRQGEFIESDTFSDEGEGIVNFIGNALTAVPVMTRRLLSNGKTSLVIDNGAQGEEMLSKIVDHVVHTVRDLDTDYEPKLVSLNLESEHTKNIMKRSIESIDSNHLSRVHKKQLNSFSEELETTKGNNMKATNPNVDTNNLINKYSRTAQMPKDNNTSPILNNVGALSQTEQNTIRTNKGNIMGERKLDNSRARTHVLGRELTYRKIQPKDNVVFVKARNESRLDNNTLDGKKIVRSKRSDDSDNNYEIDDSEILQKKHKMSKLEHIIHEKDLKDKECVKDKIYEDEIYKDKIYKGRLYKDKLYKDKLYKDKLYKGKLHKLHEDKEFHKRQKKGKSSIKKDKKIKKKLKSKESHDGHGKKRLHFKKADKEKKALLKYKRSLLLLDDNDMINDARESNSLTSSYDVKHDFKLLESENPYEEHAVNGEDFIYFIVGKNDQTAVNNVLNGEGEEIKSQSADRFQKNELRSDVKSRIEQKVPLRETKVVYEVLPESLIDPAVRAVFDSMGNGRKYEQTQSDFTVPLDEATDNIPNLNLYSSQDDELRSKIINVIAGGLGELLQGSDTDRIFPVEHDVEYRIGNIGEYADDYLLHGSENTRYDIVDGNSVPEARRQQNIVWPFEEVTEIEITGIDEATHNELSKLLGNSMKVLIEMPPHVTFPESIIEQGVGNEDEEHRNKRSIIDNTPYAGPSEWYEDVEMMEERVVKKPYKLDGGLRYKYRDYVKGSDDDSFPNETLIKELIEGEEINNEIFPDPDRSNNVHRKNFIPRNQDPINYIPISPTINSTNDDDQTNSTKEIQTQTEKIGEVNTETSKDLAESENSLTTPEGVQSDSSEKVTSENQPNFFNKIINSLSKAYCYVRNLIFPS